MTRVYISGPVTNAQNPQDVFDGDERLLREAGYETFNPMTISEPSTETLE